MGAPVSRSTLLRLLRALPDPEAADLAEVGIDDFAVRRGRVYGTIVIDMGTHHPVDVLPDRTSTTVSAWLSDHPGIEVICRDRAGAYADAARTGAPDALQVADRWHLWHNLAEHLGKVVPHHHDALSADPDEQHQQDGHDKEASHNQQDKGAGRDEQDEQESVDGQAVPAAVLPSNRLAARTLARHAAVHELFDTGRSIAAISRQLHLDPHTVRRFARAADVQDLLTHAGTRGSVLDPTSPTCTNAGTRA
jgi:transposase